MIGAGTIINPILKVITTVAILGAVYIFVVKPVLETTEDISGNVSRTAQQASQDFDLNFAKDRAENYASSLRSQWPQAAREVTDCVRRADKSARAMARCDDLGQDLVTRGQSPRTFSLSYANTLQTQGKSAEAAQVETCIDRAQFDVRAILRCRALADRLLFP